MRVLTWNIQWGKGCDGVVDLTRIVATARAMGDPDVYCFQEVAENYPALDGGRGENQPATLQRLLPGYAMVWRPAIDRPASGRRFGNIVFSRLPVLDVASHLLPRPVEPGVRSMQRHAVEVTVEAAFGPIRVVTTHLEYYSAGHRAAQIARLRALYREAAARDRLAERRGAEQGPYETPPPAAGTLLCGDFNFEPGWPDYAAMTAPFEDGAPGFRDGWTVAHPVAPHDPTCGVGDREQWADGPNCRDFAFLGVELAPRLTALRVDTVTTASDHQPVLIELE
jgi:endonuclease/exonuclease/phosphatase family metal-dependent hydrolase